MPLESNKPAWLALVTVLFVHILLIALPSGDPPRTGLVRTLIIDGVTPFEKLFDLTVHTTVSLWGDYIALVDTERENRMLQDELSEMRMQIDSNREQVLEAERLRRLLDLELPSAREGVVARVIGGDTTLVRHTVTVDKGSLHGLHIDAPVMTADGVVGRVIQTAHFASVIQLLSDAESAIGVIERENRVQGLVRGDGSSSLTLEHVNDDTAMAVGIELVTSGTDRIYPKGLPVGRIVEILPVQDLTRSARIEPFAALGRLEEVLILIEGWGNAELIEDLKELRGKGPLL